MRVIRRDNEIHDTSGSWFRARWHFSFDDYRDPDNDGFGALRVFNDDRLVPGAIWPLHPHRDVEGLTYVVEGLFGHEDDLGGPYGPLPAGSVQRMTLGSGAWHSEQNASQDEGMRFIQLWILPDTANLTPGVEQRALTKDDRSGKLLRVFAPMAEAHRDQPRHPGEGESLADIGGTVFDTWAGGHRPVGIHQDASIYVSALDRHRHVEHKLKRGRGAYLYTIEGRLIVEGEGRTDELLTGDAAKITDEPEFRIKAEDASELILVDVPMQFEAVGVWAGRV
jgi:redox-sensitive bicupin YhaK (pirin superfamily)